MAISLKPDAWVYVIVVDPGGHEQYLGLTDRDDTPFIPAFLTKDDAQSCLLDMPREKKKKYEVQAILREELEKDAAANGFKIYFLDGQGQLAGKSDITGK